MGKAGWMGFVLLGGRSTRMGRDKALLSFGGQPLAAWAATCVRAAAGSATLVGSRRSYASLGEAIGCPVIEDLVPGRGPLGGVHAVLKQSQASWNLIVPCDLPFLTADFLRFIVAQGSAADDAVQMVVPITDRGYELTLAIRSDAIGAAEEAIASGENKLSRFYERLKRRELSPPEYAKFDPRGMLFENVNTQEDLDRARKNWPQSGGVAENPNRGS